MAKLPFSFYQRDDVVIIAKELIGKQIFTNVEGVITGGIITETEAYRGRGDRACHANEGRRTKRTEIMYASGGKAYVYLCYGIHNLFNITTNVAGTADAILLRAIEPTHGIEEMLLRRNKTKVVRSLTSGPGSASQALGIKLRHYGEDITGDVIWIEEGNRIIREADIHATTRIGIDYAGSDALYPWRFYLRNTDFISKK